MFSMVLLVANNEDENFDFSVCFLSVGLACPRMSVFGKLARLLSLLRIF